MLGDKIIIFGGTFDPIHNGHLQLAEQLYKTFKSPITFMPTGIPPYKKPPQASNLQRLDMLHLAISSHPEYQIDTREINGCTYSYTYKTLQNLRLEVGSDILIYFVIGSDSLITLDTWHEWETLLKFTHFIVAFRNGYKINTFKSAKLKKIFIKNSTTDLNNLSTPYGKFYMLNFTPQDVSSTLIRQMVYNHQDISQLVPPNINAYITQQKLYTK